jgi:hypothetical protein
MIERKSNAKMPREHFMRAAEDELVKFVRKEIAFQQAERDERATQLRLPIARENSRSSGTTGRSSERPQ